jgi:hypothetical protein
MVPIAYPWALSVFAQCSNNAAVPKKLGAVVRMGILK